MLDGLFAHPAGDSDTNTPRELIAVYCAKIEFFRSLLKKKIEAIRTVLDDDYRVDFELLTTGTLTDAAQADLTAYADKFSEFDAFTASLHLVDRAAVETRLAEARVQPAIRHTIKLDPAKTFSMDLPGARTVIAAVPLRECLNLPGEVAALIDAINKQPTLVVDPRATAKALEATGEILPLAATCIENAMQSARMQDEAANKVFSPQNWLKANRSWQGETLVAGTQAGMLGSFAGGGVLMERAKVPATAFTARWSAD